MVWTYTMADMTFLKKDVYVRASVCVRVCVCACHCVCVCSHCMSMHHKCTTPLRGQKRLQMVENCHVVAGDQAQGSQEEQLVLLTVKPSLQPYMTLFMTCTHTDLYFRVITSNSSMYCKEHTLIFTYTSKSHFPVGTYYYDIKIVLIYRIHETFTRKTCLKVQW